MLQVHTFAEYLCSYISNDGNQDLLHRIHEGVGIDFYVSICFGEASPCAGRSLDESFCYLITVSQETSETVGLNIEKSM